MIDRTVTLLKTDYQALVQHHVSPDSFYTDPIDIYYESVNDWLENYQETHPVLIWDRGHPCTWFYEQNRYLNEELRDISAVRLELWLKQIFKGQVAHVLIKKKWAWSAPHHLDELNPSGVYDLEDWELARRMNTRQKIHQGYYAEVGNYLTYQSLFPTYELVGDQTTCYASDVANQVLGIKGRVLHAPS